jgi:hypothetical protein
MKTFTPPPELHAALEQMSRDMAVPVEALVNQAVFHWAKLHGYVEPGVAVASASDEPQTSRVPVVEAPADDAWKVVAGGSLLDSDASLDLTTPQMKALKRLVLLVDGEEHVVRGDRFLVGRDVSCDLTIDTPRVSRQHAVIISGPKGFELQDLGSSNGTWFAGERIEQKALEHGDEVLIGDKPVVVALR